MRHGLAVLFFALAVVLHMRDRREKLIHQLALAVVHVYQLRQSQPMRLIQIYSDDSGVSP